MPANIGAPIKVVQLKDSLHVLYTNIQSELQHRYQQQGGALKLHCLVFDIVIIYKNWTLLVRSQSFAKTNCHCDKDTTMVAGETVAFSLKDVYLFKPGCMHAFILQQHCLSQESRYCLSKLEKVP